MTTAPPTDTPRGTTPASPPTKPTTARPPSPPIGSPPPSPSKTPSTPPAPPTRGPAEPSPAVETPQRLLSLDAYRGFIMLAMASSAFGFAQVAKNESVVNAYTGLNGDSMWRWLWETLAYQFDHVAWGGCAFWDLIQPSFMFMVGVALPFSNARRQREGQSLFVRFLHVLWRSAVLVLLGVFLSSNGAALTNFTFVNVLTQIGLGYPFLYLCSEKSGRRENTAGWIRFQGVAAGLILAAYTLFFAAYVPPEAELNELKETLTAAKKTEADWTQFTGFAAHWNKHTNAAAAVDRRLLNQFPRAGESPEKRCFWFNDGGYQTLNFVPSLATMLFGLMAGTLLRGERTPWEKFRWLVIAGGICFVIVLPLDTTIWPALLQGKGATWSLCPTVKRIWTPTWAVFSSGWTFWILSAFYLVIDLWGWRRWAWPLAVVGVNSITMYCMSQLMRPFVKSALKTHGATIDQWAQWEQGINYYLFDPQFAYSPIVERVAVLFVFWLVCVWLYTQKIFVRI
ncbi:MAG: hypothetical protein U1A77_12365 [Pirellulales bacterium]